jgi:hypothetical protein
MHAHHIQATCVIACGETGKHGKIPTRADKSSKWIREGLTFPFLKHRPPPPFNQGVSSLDATPEQLTFVHADLARFVET